MNDINIKFKNMREATGMSQSQFAHYFNMSVGNIHNWEQGVCKPAGYLVEMMRKILTHDEKLPHGQGWYDDE